MRGKRESERGKRDAAVYRMMCPPVGPLVCPYKNAFSRQAERRKVNDLYSGLYYSPENNRNIFFL